MSYVLTANIYNEFDFWTIDDQIIDEISTTNGRQDPSQTFGPSSCSFRFLRGSSAGDIDPDALQLGNKIAITVDYSPSGGIDTIFTGRITDISLSRDTGTITASSQLLSRLGRGKLPEPFSFTGLTGDAIANVNGDYPYLIDPTTAVYTFSTGTKTVTVNASAGANVLSVWQQITNSEPLGILYEAQGKLYFEDVNDRKFLAPDVELVETEIIDSWQAVKASANYSNRVSVQSNAGLGLDELAADVTEKGAIEFNTATYLDTLDEANSLATLLLYRRTNPKYSLQSISIPIAVLDDVRANELFFELAKIGAKVRLPAIDPDLQLDYFVEGWDDQISAKRFTRRLYISDYRITNGVQFWDDVPASTTWGDVSFNQPALTWDAATGEWVE